MGKKCDIPVFNQPIIETHFHLDYLKEDSAENLLAAARAVGVERFMRSEEHTSELQSRPHLVCRLLLEKKKSLPGRTGRQPPDAWATPLARVPWRARTART